MKTKECVGVTGLTPWISAFRRRAECARPPAAAAVGGPVNCDHGAGRGVDVDQALAKKACASRTQYVDPIGNSRSLKS
jgi:hypothetical protein